MDDWVADWNMKCAHEEQHVPSCVHDMCSLQIALIFVTKDASRLTVHEVVHVIRRS
jgi:hypothetical protein